MEARDLTDKFEVLRLNQSGLQTNSAVSKVEQRLCPSGPRLTVKLSPGNPNPFAYIQWRATHLSRQSLAYIVEELFPRSDSSVVQMSKIFISSGQGQSRVHTS